MKPCDHHSPCEVCWPPLPPAVELPPPPADPLVDRLTTWWGSAIASALLIGLALLCAANRPWVLPLPLTGLAITFLQLVRHARLGQPHVPFGSTER